MHARHHDFLNASRIIRPRVWTGLLLNGSYKVGPLTEQGATTELYEGTEASTGEPIALKILLPQLAEDARTRALFLDEARALTRLSQPGLLRYRSCARDPQYDLNYIVTDVVGARLSSRLAARRPTDQDIVSLTRRLAVALGAAHRAGVVHRGLRPHAIALPEGRLADATITDFNLIKTAHSGLNAAFNDAMLDRDYCAPEQLSTSGQAASGVGPWTDVYSLALVILAAIEGKAVGARGPSGPDLSPLPKALRPIFAKMLQATREERWQSMDEVVEQLDLAFTSTPFVVLKRHIQAIRLPRVDWSAVRQRLSPRLEPAVRLEPASVPLTPEATIQEALIRLRKARQASALPLSRFHEARGSISLGGVARRAAVVLSSLLVATLPWILQTTLHRGPAGASTVPPVANVEAVQEKNEVKVAPLPAGRVFGSDNSNSRFTLRIHRPTRLTVHGRGERLLFSRSVERGDVYRAPTLPGLVVSADDAGAVEVMIEGKPAGFIGRDGAAARQTPLQQFASAAPPAARSQAQAAKAVARPAPPSPGERAVAEAIAAIGKGMAAPELIVEGPSADAAPAVAAAPRVESQSAASNLPVGTPQPTTAVAPPVTTQSVPSPPAVVTRTPPPEQQVVIAPPTLQPEARRRPVLDFILRRNRTPAAAEEPVATKQAPDRDKAASDMAKAAREAAERKANADERGRDRSFFNSALGITAPY